jgi:hypothetical protein
MPKPQWIARQLRDEIRAITRGVPMRWVSADEPDLRRTEKTQEAIGDRQHRDC